MIRKIIYIKSLIPTAQFQWRGNATESLNLTIALAIKTGNSDAAARATTDHVLVQGERLRDLVALLDSFQERQIE
ncbi:hypothetical protein [Paracoccus sp. JM45]|uniref:hypothetical protein n=1 Tax=Paracoccus sp. JM45 TaxID=2283626 RepID=UPI0016043118|nr:hypothetical protein [Paracoccus sp. JM45]